MPDSLSLRQKVPNKAEKAVVGKIISKIKRSDGRFNSLIKHSNSNIVFKDEEGTGADRMMTQKLADKLDALARLVKTEWPALKLRVTEAWDETGEHSPTSTHYEGRAADLTLSDRDGGKLGRLGQLAVDAGFDWVFYEDKSHINVSMKR